MGAYTCEFGVVHKVCRCPKSHTIKCNKVAEHGLPLLAPCNKVASLGKREKHEPHDYFYAIPNTFGDYITYRCPGRD